MIKSDKTNIYIYLIYTVHIIYLQPVSASPVTPSIFLARSEARLRRPWATKVCLQWEVSNIGYLAGGFSNLETYESQWERSSHILWKINNVLNHQPDMRWYDYKKSMAYRYILRCNHERLKLRDASANDGGWDANEMTWKNPCTTKSMNQWTIESMNRWTNESMNQWINEATKQSLNESTNLWTNESMNQRINEATKQWLHESTDQWTNESMNQRINKSMKQWINQSMNVMNQWIDESVHQ
jgi:hypothetical protein